MQLHRDREEFEKAGARLVAIGQGTPRHAEHFMEEYELDGMEVLVDPDRKTYKAAGTKIARFDELVNPKTVVRGAKITATRRITQGKVQGHAAQLGGVLVVAPDGTVVWSHLSDDPSDNPPTEQVLAAAREAATKG